ncbi:MULTISPECIES: DUF551 domain-containing protein [Enterobacter]|uniref:DUF551 domain-containing protein n=1 Tax=Enterobacter TaxID=547 RepID=UPI002074CB89|nr:MULTISPECIES: DUF551 domain-containing protein [Enterobacter]MCM7702518.1 DUF551 domain-containing protein [Enterobacter hormaechei]MCM7704149.1 DUF551 domain-containing protein [Enterobacter hormaechei]MCM7708645.1 DUF551 domain-containing protein [Enterobacter hormaechei]MCM7716002.1 DUF551 domain-containing protein [Enterobacter hormaechei]MCM7762511.1 DUF551 domain-containing protein [Enterobacter hormaechei]
MAELTKEWLLKTIAELEEEHDATPGAVNEDATMALAAMKLALASLEAEPVAYIFKHPTGRLFWSLTDESNKGQSDVMPVYTASPAPVSVPDDVSGPLAHAYKELTPTFMRNHIDVFERYGIYPEGSAGIQAMRIALDGMNRRAAMLQSFGNSEQLEPVMTAYKLPAIGWLRADYQDDNRGLRGNAPLFVLGKKDPSSLWGLDYIPLTAKSPVIPDGWVLVPEEPTHEMLEAGDEQFGTYDVYRRMVAASPQQK